MHSSEKSHYWKSQYVTTADISMGATEFAGQENAGLENDGKHCRGWTVEMQDWKMSDKSTGLENAGLENDGQAIKASYVELHNLTLLSRKYWTQVVIKS